MLFQNMCHVLLVDTTEKSLSTSSSFPHDVLVLMDKIPPVRLFFKLNSLSSLSLSIYGKCSSSLMIFGALHWTPASMSRHCLQWEAQNWTQCCICSPTSAKQRGRITCLDVLSTFLLMEPGRLLATFAVRVHGWIIIIFLLTRHSGASLQRNKSKVVFPLVRLQHVLVLGIILPRYKTLHFPLLHYMRYFSARFSSMPSYF